MRTQKLFALAISLALIVGLRCAVARAQVKPGDTITPENAAKVKDLVSPGVFYMVRKGMRLDIVSAERVEWPPPYKEATEKYSAQVRLSRDHRSLVGYVAGQPFPMLDANDPYVATKIIWNTVYRPIGTDDYDLRYFECDNQYVRPGKPQNMVDFTTYGHYAGYDLVGRTEVEPLPTDPDFKVSGRLWAFAIYPQLAPQDSIGDGLLRYRYADPSKADDTWIWASGSRRLRRLNESMLSTNMGVGYFDANDYSGFNPKTEEYSYRLLGEKQMLGCVHAAHSPEVACPYDGGATACPENWEMRHEYIVEATPRGGAGNVLEKNDIVYVDSEVWFSPYVDHYDRSGRLWRTNIFWLTYRDRPVPDARVAIYPFKREFVLGSSEIEVQQGFSTMCYLPARNTPERECWYINMGAVDKNFLTTQAMVKAAP
ncbi:MAG: DUF1329 domain-containing protein [Candidatus Binataceae bacterium]